MMGEIDKKEFLGGKLCFGKFLFYNFGGFINPACISCEKRKDCLKKNLMSLEFKETEIKEIIDDYEEWRRRQE